MSDSTPSAAETLTAGVVDELVSGRSDVGIPAALDEPSLRPRRVLLPIIFFLLTCLSTFWVGANRWIPILHLWMISGRQPEMALVSRQMVMNHWDLGLLYSACVLSILLAHEFGHFLATVRYRVPASLPYVVPMPLMPIGTFGAVIGMDSRKADRKQTFDIGLAGPLAGLVLAVPIMIVGILKLDLSQPVYGPLEFNNPLLVELLLRWMPPEGYRPWQAIPVSQLNPYYMAGWVGLLITGLNMLPVSQLDGGHVIYTLFGKRSRWVARSFMLLACGFVVYMMVVSHEPSWILMVILIGFIGIDHPPTRDDSVPIGWFRFWLGLVSLAIPLLCFAPLPITLPK